jgi:phosphatidate cytidylyltransferase
VSNLSQRVLVALLGIPLVVSATTYGSWPLFLFVILVQGLLLYEWQQLSLALQSRPFLPTLILCVVGIDLAVFFSFDSSFLNLAYGAFLLMLLIEVFRDLRQPLRNLGISALFLVYVAVPLALWTQFGSLQVSERYGAIGPLTTLLVATWICDSAAYFIGRTMGRHKLYAAASPNKTIEGAMAGLLFSGLVLPVMSWCGWAEPSWHDFVILPLIVGVAGQLGDLLESLMKREAQVKDTSQLLPGHGGLLDRFDSLLLSSPLFFLYLRLVQV